MAAEALENAVRLRHEERDCCVWESFLERLKQNLHHFVANTLNIRSNQVAVGTWTRTYEGDAGEGFCTITLEGVNAVKNATRLLWMSRLGMDSRACGDSTMEPADASGGGMDLDGQTNRGPAAECLERLLAAKFIGDGVGGEGLGELAGHFTIGGVEACPHGIVRAVLRVGGGLKGARVLERCLYRRDKVTCERHDHIADLIEKAAKGLRLLGGDCMDTA
jgi:hypothetical protein